MKIFVCLLKLMKTLATKKQTQKRGRKILLKNKSCSLFPTNKTNFDFIEEIKLEKNH